MSRTYYLGLLAMALSTALACSSDGTSGQDLSPGMDAGTVPRTGPQPYITEFLTKNQAGLTDEDGTTSDWIEIYNPDTQPIDLGGYHLTDSSGKPTRWTFPSGAVIAPGGYLVVFASGKNRAVAGKPLHTNFQLSSGTRASSCTQSGGAYLALTSPSGDALPPVWNPYPGQSSDLSYGLMKNATDAGQAFFAKPTPGAANDTTSALAERVTFSPTSKTFNSGTTLPVTLSVTSPTATIRYTTNRARPIAVAGKLGNFTADMTTDVCTMTAHGFASGDLVRVSGPAPLVTAMNYFVIPVDASSFKLAVEPGGPAIDLKASGTFEIRREAITGVVNTATDVVTTTPPITFLNGDAVQVSISAGGMLPAGLTAGTTYYVSVQGPNSFKLATTAALTTAVDITTAGTGTLTTFRIPSPVYSAPIPVSLNTRIRAQTFEPGRPDGPIVSEAYFALDAAAQTFSSNLPLVLTTSWNVAIQNNNVPVESYIMVFEPKPADNNLAKLTNPPDMISPCTLERHGSSTGGDPKFSMALELQDENGIDQSCSPFGMPAESDWLMHAPYQFDRSMMHNDLLYRLSNEVGRYAVRTKFIEHIHNEQSLPDTIEGAITGIDYFGVYSFQEKIKRGPDRVNIDGLSITDTTSPTIDGGYMFKADRLDAGESGIRPLAGQSFGNAGTGGPGANILAWVYPRETSTDPFRVVNQQQSDFLRGYLGAGWAALSGATFTDPVTGYAKYWDVGSVIDHHILNTATKNADAFRLSSYWHKPRTGKITAGPVWDFDRAQGSTDGRDFDYGTWTAAGGTDFFTYPWYKEMMLDPNFWQQWIDRYAELRQGPLSAVNVWNHVDEFAAILNPGNGANTPAKRTVQRWTASVPRAAGSNNALTNNLFDGTYLGEVAWLKYWWERRLLFMDTQVTRPVVPIPAAGTVSSGTTVTLTSQSQIYPGIKIYYTTDGSDPRASGGSPSATAQVYSGPLPIGTNVKLTMRAWNPAPVAPVASGWSALSTASYTVQ